MNKKYYIILLLASVLSTMLIVRHYRYSHTNRTDNSTRQKVPINMIEIDYALSIWSAEQCHAESILTALAVDNKKLHYDGDPYIYLQEMRIQVKKMKNSNQIIKDADFEELKQNQFRSLVCLADLFDVKIDSSTDYSLDEILLMQSDLIVKINSELKQNGYVRW